MIELDSRKLRLVLLGAMALSVVAFFGITFFGLSLLGSKSQAMVDLKLQSQTADNKLSSLEQAKKEIEKYSYFKEVAKTVIPSEKNQAQTIVEIFKIADAAGISIQGITFPASTLGTRSTVTPQDATAKTAAQSAITQAKPVSGIPGLYSLELTITPELSNQVPSSKRVTYAKMLDFLRRIENNRHTAQITQVNIQPPGVNNQAFTFNLVINIFIKP